MLTLQGTLEVSQEKQPGSMVAKNFSSILCYSKAHGQKKPPTFFLCVIREKRQQLNMHSKVPRGYQNFCSCVKRMQTKLQVQNLRML